MVNQPTFFDFAAEVGLTKHFGGLDGTQKLVELCHISDASYILDVGCGVGVVPGLVIEKSPIKTAVRILDVKPVLEPYIVGIAAQKRRLGSPVVNAFWRVAASLSE